MMGSLAFQGLGLVLQRTKPGLRLKIKTFLSDLH